MNITGQVWLALTVDERITAMEFNSAQNQLRWAKRKAACARGD